MSSIATRVLGPNLASRLGDGSKPSDGDRLNLNVEVRSLTAGLFAGAGSLGLLSVLITAFFADDIPQYRPALVAAITATGLLTSLLILAFWSLLWHRPLVLHGLLGGGTCLVAVASWASGPEFAPFGMIFYLWTAVAAGCFMHQRGVVLHLVVVGAASAIVLALLEPTSSPVARWVLVVGTCVFTGLIIDRFNEQIQSVAIEEAAARDEAERVTERLAEASRHKSEFLASMSHELRTPLNAVIGFSDVLLTQHFGVLNETQTEYVEDIRDSGHHLLALINDVLDLSKVEAGRMEIDARWFNISECIHAALNLVHVRAEAARIAMRVEPASGAMEAFGDERRIKQVLVNLLNNAVKFTPAGGEIVVRADRDGGDLCVSVTDNGVGIAEEDQERIFEDFQQVGDAELGREGSGLGLALARRLLELHEGSISVVSSPGEGSTFTLTLPTPAAHRPEPVST